MRIGARLAALVHDDRIAFQYCHLASNSVNLGDIVVKDQPIGIMGKTGNTSGAHLHLNLFETDVNGIRLNRDNGYFGGIDPLPFLNSDNSTVKPVVEVFTDVFENLVTKSTAFDKVAEKLNKPQSVDIVLSEVDQLLKIEERLVEKDKQLEEFKVKLDDITGQLKQKSDTIEKLKIENTNLQTKVTEQLRIITELDGTIDSAISEIEDLKKQSNKPFTAYSGVELIVKGFGKLFGKG